MGVNLLPFVDADRIKKIVEIVIKKGELTEKDKKLNERGDNILITRDLMVSNYFQGDLSIHEKMNTYGKFLKDDLEIKGIHPGNVNKDKSQIYIFKKKINGRKHCSKILNGVQKEPKYIFEDYLDNYNKKRFNGKTAIEIVEEVLGTKYEDIEGKVIREMFDDKYGNNNMGLPDDPQMKFLLMKKRARENERKSMQGRIINKNNNIIENIGIQNNRINQKNNNVNNEEKPKKEIIPLNEEENELKQNIKTKKKFDNQNDKKETIANIKFDTNLYNKLTDLMTGLNKNKKKKTK